MLQNYFKTILFLFSFFFFRFFLRVINAARALVKEARSLSPLPSPYFICDEVVQWKDCSALCFLPKIVSWPKG